MRLLKAGEGLQMPLMRQLSTASPRRERKGHTELAGLAEEGHWGAVQKLCSDDQEGHAAQLVVGRKTAAAAPHRAYRCHTSLDKAENP